MSVFKFGVLGNCIGFLWFGNAIYRIPWLVLRILRARISHQLLINNHKMEVTKFEIRVLLKHYWKQDYKAAAAARKICEVEGEGVVSERVAQRWFQRFNNGEENTKDLPRSGRPKVWNIEDTSRALEEDPQKSTRRLSEELGASKDTIHRQIKTLGKSYRSCRSVPHELTPAKIQELGGIELLPHPAYSPDLAPSDYHLFRSMAHFLRRRNFDNIEAVQVGLAEFFASKTRNWYRRGIMNLAERWLKTIESNGLYFEE